MTTSNRAAKIAKTHKVLKKHFKPATVADRPLLEQMLYACCLQAATPVAADEAFAKLQQTYFDWNEVRVTTISELADVMNCLPRASETASNLKKTLQAVFETHYSFDLESLKKENIGKSVKQLEKLTGVTPFVLSFVTQNGLNGHSIAISDASLEVLRIIGVISDDEAKQKKVPGLERAIPKNRGVEFGSLLHQLGADYAHSPHSQRVRAILLEISPDAKDRFPRRLIKKTGEEGEAATHAENSSGDSEKSRSPKKEKEPDAGPKKDVTDKDKSKDKDVAKPDEAAKKHPAKAAGDKSAGEKSAADKPAGDKSAGEKFAGEKSAGDKSDAPKRPVAESTAQKSPLKKLTKKKPR
jgi:endonuclease-3